MIFFVASAMCSNFALLFVGIVDLFFAGGLAFATFQLADIVPRNYDACNKVGVWRSANDGRSFFVEAYDRAAWEEGYYARDLCQDMVRIWACAIATV